VINYFHRELLPACGLLLVIQKVQTFLNRAGMPPNKVFELLFRYIDFFVRLHFISLSSSNAKLSGWRSFASPLE
jgi:hypothetical protein